MSEGRRHRAGKRQEGEDRAGGRGLDSVVLRVLIHGHSERVSTVVLADMAAVSVGGWWYVVCDGGWEQREEQVSEALGRWDGGLDLPAQHLVHRDAKAVGARALADKRRRKREEGQVRRREGGREGRSGR